MAPPPEKTPLQRLNELAQLHHLEVKFKDEDNMGGVGGIPDSWSLVATVSGPALPKPLSEIGEGASVMAARQDAATDLLPVLQRVLPRRDPVRRDKSQYRVVPMRGGNSLMAKRMELFGPVFQQAKDDPMRLINILKTKLGVVVAPAISPQNENDGTWQATLELRHQILDSTGGPVTAPPGNPQSDKKRAEKSAAIALLDSPEALDRLIALKRTLKQQSREDKLGV